MTGVHADIDALKGLHAALIRFRQAQLDAADRSDDQIEATRAALEAKAIHWHERLGRCQGELEACRERAAEAVHEDDAADCSGYARAVDEATQRLEQVRRWQWRVDQEASEFRGTASRFRDLLEITAPRGEDHLLDMIMRLEAARRLQVPGT